MLGRPTFVVVVSLTLALAAAGPSSPSRAQEAPAAGASPGAGGGNGLIVILLAPAVQQELKLTDDQKTRVFELARDASRKSREFFQAAIRSGGNNPQALMMAGVRLRQESERAADQILKPEQKDRAHQILYRVEGPLAVARPEVSEKLGLSRAQVQQVQVTMMQMMQAQRSLFQAGNDGADSGAEGSGRDAPARLRAAAGQQIGRALDAKQKNAFNKMLGEPFDIARIDPEFATKTAPTSGDPPAGKTEKSRARRKRAKGAAPKDKAKDEAEDARPKP